MKRRKNVYELDSDDDLVERMHISSDAKDDVDQLVKIERDTEMLGGLDDDISPMVRSLYYHRVTLANRYAIAHGC